MGHCTHSRVLSNNQKWKVWDAVHWVFLLSPCTISPQGLTYISTCSGVQILTLFFTTWKASHMISLSFALTSNINSPLHCIEGSLAVFTETHSTVHASIPQPTIHAPWGESYCSWFLLGSLVFNCLCCGNLFHGAAVRCESRGFSSNPKAKSMSIGLSKTSWVYSEWDSSELPLGSSTRLELPQNPTSFECRQMGLAQYANKWYPNSDFKEDW